MGDRLSGKKALVTGGSRGIGRAVALGLAAQGAAVAVHFNRETEAAEEVVARIASAGGTAFPVSADLRHPGEVDRLFAAVLERFAALDILVNNAGMLRTGPIEHCSESEFDDLFALNVKSVFFCCRQAARTMADNGRIINISSTVTRMLLPGYGLYAASKGAVDQITRVLAKELGGRGITVNAVSPGPTDTELFRSGKSEEQIAGLASMAALGRIGLPGDIAALVCWLAGSEAAWVSGENICANGGMAA